MPNAILNPERIKAVIDATNLKVVKTLNEQLFLQAVEQQKQELEKKRIAFFNCKITWKGTSYDLHKVLLDPQFKVVHTEIENALTDIYSVENWLFLVELAKANLIGDERERTNALNNVHARHLKDINIPIELKKELAKKNPITLNIHNFEPVIIALVALINHNLRSSNCKTTTVDVGPRKTSNLTHKRQRSEQTLSSLSAMDLESLERMSNPSARGASTSVFFPVPSKLKHPAAPKLVVYRAMSQINLAATGHTAAAAGRGAAAASVTSTRVTMFLAPNTGARTGSASPSLSSDGSTPPSPMDSSPISGAIPPRPTTGSILLPVSSRNSTTASAVSASLSLGWMAAGDASGKLSPKNGAVEPVIVLSAYHPT